MKKVLEIYDHKKTYLFPNMMQATPDEVAKNYSAVNIPGLTCVFETDISRTMFYTVPEPIDVIKDRYNIDPSLSDKDAILAIEAILNTPQPEIETEPSAEERIAAALEFQNLLNI